MILAPVLAFQAASPLESRIDDLLKPFVPAKAPGIAVVVQKGGETLYRRAFGSADLAGKIPLTTGTPMKVGSLSKAFAAAVVQGLAGEGRLSLDDPISKWFPDAPANWKSITVRNLLNHTSGLVSYTEIPAVLARIAKPGTQEEIVAAVERAEPKFAPGTRFEYSNTNYNLLGLIAERAGGAPLETLMKQRIFDPLGMATASLERKGTYRADEARGSYLVKGKPAAMPPVDMSWPYAAGSVVASVDDLARWLAGLAGGKVLNERQRAEAFSPAELKDGSLSFYGFGWVLGTRGSAPLIGHEGKINGFTSYVAYLPASDVRVALVTNTYDGVAAQRVVFDILDAVEGKPARPKPLEDRDPKLTARLKGVFAAMLRGERDELLFAPGFLKAIPKEQYAKIGRSLAEVGELGAFELVEERREGAGVVRSYRASLGDADVTAVFVVDGAGKIAGFRLR